MLLFGGITFACLFIPAEVRGGDELPSYIGLPIGIALLAGGTYRKSITLDRAAGQADICRRVAGITFRRESRQLKSFDRVSLGTRIKRSDNRRYTVYFVSLCGSSTIELDERQIADFARHSAERVAKFLELPLHDVSSGKMIVRDAASLGMSLREKAGRADERAPLPNPPENLRTDIDLSQGSVAILSVPAPGWSLGSLLSTIPPCAFGAFMLWMTHDAFAIDTDVGELVIAGIATLVGVLCIFGSLGFVIAHFTRRVTVTASSEQLTIKSVSLLGWRTRVVAADSVDEVLVLRPTEPRRDRKKRGGWNSIGRGGVSIRSDGKTIKFGGHLPNSEQEFLSRFIRAILEARW